MNDIDESDCCGNGCANCILNIKPAKSYNAEKTGKQNIIASYTKFLLLNKTLHSPQVDNVWEFHFKSKHCNNKDFILDINAGYHLMMRKCLTEVETSEENEVGKERKYLLRPYSPFWWDVMEMEFKILVDIIPNGPMCAYLKKLEINDKVEFRGPIGTFHHQLDARGETCLLIISQGVAVAPAISIVEDILNNEDDMTRIVHIACYKDLRHTFFREKLYEFSKYWNYKVNIYLSKELCDSSDCINKSKCSDICKNFKSKLKYKEVIIPHRLMQTDFRNVIDNLGHRKENTYITISGSGTFQSYFNELCQRCGFLKKNINLL